MAVRKKKKGLKRLMAKYRFTVVDEGSFEEKVAFRLSRFNVAALIALIFFLLTSIVFSLLVFTPLRNYIPGYADDQMRADAAQARYIADSLLSAQQTQERYINHVKLILSGELVPDEHPEPTSDTTMIEESFDYDVSLADSILRAKVAEEDRFDFEIDEDTQASSALSSLMFKPVEGTLSSAFDEKIGHYGIDVVAPNDAVIKAVMDGTVMFSSWTDDGGYVIQVQHSFNLVSVYKHNSTLFKVVGDAVKAGEGIAVIGNSGEETDGPHLHLELWQDGVPVDPQRFLTYEELATE